MNDDLRHAVRVVREYGSDDKQKERLAVVLSIAAIVMLIITNIWIASTNIQVAAPQAIPHESSPSAPAEAASPSVVLDCQKLQDKHWLRAMVKQKKFNADEWRDIRCYYGKVIRKDVL